MRDTLFKIFYNGEWIGSSGFEAGDPPMGVAMGLFFPEPCYFEHQALFQRLWDESQDHLGIVTIQPSGEKLPASATRIDDHPEIEASDISVRFSALSPSYIMNSSPAIGTLTTTASKAKSKTNLLN